MGVIEEPSAAMAALAARIHAWDEAGLILPEMDEKLQDDLLKAASRALSHNAEIEVVARAARDLVNTTSGTAVDYPSLNEAALLLQRLDDWHAPLLRAAGPTAVLDEDQERALERLHSPEGAYNKPAGVGALIPAAEGGARTTGPSGSLTAQLLHNTAYLPERSAAGDPDDAAAPSSRTVALRYVATRSHSSDPRGDVGDRPIVAIAPVLQDKSDAELVRKASPDAYGVHVRYDPARLKIIIADAMEQGAHLLFMPEMAINADETGTLASAIRTAFSEYRRSKGRQPQLRFVIAGLAHSSGATGNNSIIVMDARGATIFEQQKLCRWNLKWYHQNNYGVGPSCSTGTPDLKEDIPGGDTVWIADLMHLGRFLTLICADMDYDKPGDWLIRNVAVDWLHAPIMDKSIAWSRNAAGDLEPWIVERANRAADNGVPKVIVTNSMLLTLRLNDYNAKTGVYPVLKRCSIAFMLDNSPAGRSYRQLEVAVPTPLPPPILRAVRWLNGFSPFPPP